MEARGERGVPEGSGSGFEPELSLLFKTPSIEISEAISSETDGPGLRWL